MCFGYKRPPFVAYRSIFSAIECSTGQSKPTMRQIAVTYIRCIRTLDARAKLVTSMQHMSYPLREDLVFRQTAEVCDEKLEEISILVLQPFYDKEIAHRVQKMQGETHQIIDDACQRDQTRGCEYQKLHGKIDWQFGQLLDEQEYRECERLSSETLELMHKYTLVDPADLGTVSALVETLGDMWRDASKRVSPASEPRFADATTHFCDTATRMLHDTVQANTHLVTTHGSGLEANIANLSLHSFRAH